MISRLGAAKMFRLFSRKISTANEEIPTSVLDITLKKPLGSIKTIQGWVKSVRKMGKIIFLDVNDGSCLSSVQVVYPKELLNKHIQWGTSVNITGKVQANPKGQLEIAAEKMSVVGKFDVTDNFPFTPKQKQSYNQYRQFLHFRPKIDYFSCMLRLRSAASFKIHEYFHENGFIEIHTPIITSSDCEGGGETFSIMPDSQKLLTSMKKEKDVSDKDVFFSSPAYLTVSGQLHLEAVTRGMSKVYTFNPSFRAENSKSRLHLSEFYMIEAEEAFITDLESILDRIEDFVKGVTSFMLSKHLNDMEYMLKHNDTDSKTQIKMLEDLITKPFSIMTFFEAKAITTKNQHTISKSNITSLYNLTKEEELFLVKNNGNVPIFVVNWPKQEKPFYMKQTEDDGDLVKAVDLLVSNVGEMCGGSVREDSYDVLKEKLINLNMLDCLKWYLDLRKYGNVPTGGFGLGFERFLQFLLNVHNIKDTLPFPRWPRGLQL